jgi:predicted nucleic acid-binding protein
MAIVIADTSPLQYLYEVGRLDLLQDLFGTVWALEEHGFRITEAVRRRVSQLAGE